MTNLDEMMPDMEREWTGLPESTDTNREKMKKVHDAAIKYAMRNTRGKIGEALGG